MIEGHAIKIGGAIDVRTVSPSKAGAQINWLVVHRPVIPWHLHDDAAISAVFIREAAKVGVIVTCVRVKIEEIAP